MEKYILEATDENILKSIECDQLGRLSDVIDFLELVDTIDYNTFISVDASWGEGKTFFIRQIEMTMKYYNKIVFQKNKDISEQERRAFQTNELLGNLKLQHTYFPVYYNAWLYDNHSDPLMSLILSITKVCECYCDEKLNSNALSDKIISLMDSFSFSIGCVQFGSNFGNTKEKFSGKDILSVVKTEEEIRDKVKEIFDSIITENVQKLVIFIDELDRCRPNFAIEMLERIKHYFDDDRIIFVASINREQLIHSISKYYGTNFDSTGYLDKFFDWNIYLPELDTSFGNRLNFTDEQYFIENITKELSLYFQLTYREKLRYNQCISFAILSKYVSDHSGEKIVLSAFVSIITILNIKDETKKMRFLQGDSGVLDELFKSIPTLHRMACKFGKLDGQESEENFEIGYAKIKEVFDYAFGIGEKRWYKGAIEISDNFKEICLRICSGLRIGKSSV